MIRGGSLLFYVKCFLSKYILFTHNNAILSKFSKRQIVVNIWHGVGYKNIVQARGGDPIPATITVATSAMSQKMFSEFFGVSPKSVLISGYPRNDVMLQAKENKRGISQNLNDVLSKFDNLIIWLPTFRKNQGNNTLDGMEVGNPFYIKDFDTTKFNRLLKEHNTFCYLKPHPDAPTYTNVENLSNLKLISDDWLLKCGISLYQLLGCSDILISDVSSVMVDYLLMDNPIICMSEDFEEYKKTERLLF